MSGSRCNIVNVSNQESSITLLVQLGIFRNLISSAPITFGVLVGTFVGYLLDRHSYMHVTSMQGMLSLI